MIKRNMKFYCSKCREESSVKFYKSNRWCCKSCLKEDKDKGGISGNGSYHPEGVKPISQATLDQYSGTNLSRVKELREKYI